MSSSATYVPNNASRALLLCGIVTGPLFFIVFFFQAFMRTGFDMRIHPLSLLDLGDLGWIQRANFIVTGLLAIVCSLGLRRVMAGVE